MTTLHRYKAWEERHLEHLLWAGAGFMVGLAFGMWQMWVWWCQALDSLQGKL